MNEKEPFEDIIASKFSEAEFPFDEGNWDNAEEMIDSYRTKQKRRRIGFVFSSGIALGVLIMLPFVMNVNKTNNELAQVTNTITENTDPKVLNPEVQQLAGRSDADNAVATNDTQIPSTPETSNEQASVNNTPLSSDNGVASVSNVRQVVKQEISRAKQTGRTLSSTTIVPAETSNVPLENTGSKEEKLSVWDKIKMDMILTRDSIPEIVLVDAPEKPITPSIAMLPWNFSIAGGGNYVNGFSFNPIQGIEISKAIKPYLEIGTGAYYTYLSIHSGGVKTITTHTEYGFGYKADVTEIKTNKLHYVVIPVFAKVNNVDGKNSFIIGANMFALFTASNSVSTYKESYGEKQGTVSKKTTGYSNGINTYDIGLLVGYKRHLFWNIGAAVYFNYGLMDIKKNEYYNSTKFERNISGQFMLTYKL